MFKSNFISGLVSKFKSQYVPVRDTKLGIYLPTGDIAKEVKPEEKGDEVTEYRVFIDGVLTTVPAALVSTKFPVYRINKPVDQIVAGDIIRTGDSKKYTYRRVTRVFNDGRIESDSFGGTTGSKTHAIADLVLGSKTISVVVNLMKGFNGSNSNFLQNPMALALLGDSSDDDDALSKIFMIQALSGNQTAGVNNLLPLLLCGGDDDDSLKTIALMSAVNGGQQGVNNLLPLMLLGDSSDSKIDNILMLSMMSGGNNPFANLFTQQVATVAPTVEAPAADTTQEQA